VADARVDIKGLFSSAAQGVPGFWRTPPANVTWSFDGGYADPSTFPIDDLLRLSDMVLRTQTKDAIQYGGYYDGIIYGFPGLREQLAARTLVEDARAVGRENVILTSGGVQAISLAFEAFVDPGDVVVVEAPTWGAVLAMANARGAEIVAIPVDDDGLQVDLLEREIERLGREGRRPKLLYTIAAFNTPTGVTLSLDRRRRLVDLAVRHGFVILEDNVYRELRYDGEDVPTMFGLDDSGLVLKVESFSKTIAPTLRVGWATGDSQVIAAMASVRKDLGVSQWFARVLCEYLREGLYDPHLARVRERYRQKRAVAEAALHAHCDPWVQWRTPEGGFFLWVELDSAIDGELVMEKALANGVMCRPGEVFYGDADQGKQRFRLAFSEVPIEEIDRGISVLGMAIAASAR
jgi:2-aminoadipate transaminase